MLKKCISVLRSESQYQKILITLMMAREKLSAGYRASKHFAVEGSYIHLGEFDMNQEGLDELQAETGYSVTSASVEISGIGLSLVGIFPFNQKFSLFTRAGLYSWRLKAAVSAHGLGSGSDTESDTGVGLGIGLSYAATEKVDFSLEFNRYDTEGSDTDFLGAGVNFKFN